MAFCAAVESIVVSMTNADDPAISIELGVMHALFTMRHGGTEPSPGLKNTLLP